MKKKNKNGLNHIVFNDAPRKFKENRKTKPVRLSNKLHTKLKVLAKLRRATMSKTLDHIIINFFKHQHLYEIN